jgi:putative ABC transport system permease protein
MAIPFKYNVRSLLVRRVSTLMTGGGIALVVAVFVIVMAMVAGLNSAIQDTGSPDNMIVLRKGSTTETGSAFSLNQFEAMKFLSQIRRDSAGQPLASPEVPVQVLMRKIGGGRENIVLRGVTPIALTVHDKVHVIQGRMFNPALNEAIVGRALLKRYADCAIGSTIRLGRGSWKVVGIFDAAGSLFESEVWAGLSKVQDDTQRGAYYASVVLKMTPGADAPALIRRLADDPRINLQGETEPDYYRDQSVVANQLRGLGMLVAAIMAIGAIFAAMNTMYAAVAARTQEIGTLRALGFSPGAVLGSFLLESLLLAVAAGAIGVVLALPVNGLSTAFGNYVTFSTLSFQFRVTLAIMIQALLFAAVMGVAGGFLPARQAMRMSVVDALRRS